jgi:hypothetical protein
MKKATRLLILTAFVLPLSLIGSAYAGGPGGPVPVLRPYYSGSNHSGIRHSDPFSTSLPTTDGFQPGADDPLHLQDPIGGPGPDFNRDDLHDRFPFADRDPHAGAHYGDPVGNGGQTAPIDGGITLLLAAGIGLGIRKARNRKQLV